MKNIKILFVGLVWCSFIAGLCASYVSEQEQNDLLTVCARIVEGEPDPEYPIAEDVLKKILLVPFVDKVSFVPLVERKPLVDLVVPWFNMEKLDVHELLLRKNMIELTEKLAHVCSNDRNRIMFCLNRVVEMVQPELVVIQNDRPVHLRYCVDNPKHAARQILWKSVSTVDVVHLKLFLENTLLFVEHVPQGSVLHEFLAKAERGVSPEIF